jgi:hypothetical protein
MCCFALGDPVKKLIAAIPIPITARVGRTKAVSFTFKPNSEESKSAKTSFGIRKTIRKVKTSEKNLERSLEGCPEWNIRTS